MRKVIAGSIKEFEYEGSATLSGLHRVEGKYPTLAPGGRVEERLLRTDEIDRLDAYEGVDSGLYVRVSVPVEGPGDRESAAVYVGNPTTLDAPDLWLGPESFPACVTNYLDTYAVTISTDRD
ncbi:MAG: gamma-glutamylcyclotransferase family protein [Halapricum sp.]